MLSGLPQQNGNTVPNQIQNPRACLNAPTMDPEFLQIRKLLQEKIMEFLMQECRQSHEVPYWKLVDVVKRLEEGLFRSATTKEEYMNLATLEQRLHVLIKRPSMNNHNQQLSNASLPIGTDHLDESRVSNPYHLSEMQNQFQQFSLGEHSGASLLFSQRSEQMQQFGGNPQNDFAGLSDSIQPDAALNQGVRGEIHHRLTGQDVSQPNNLSSEEGRSNNITLGKKFKNQQRWLISLRHARRCPAPERRCHDSNCSKVQKLLKHMERCNCSQCAYPHCRATRVLVNHHRRCRDESCPVCIPVKNFVLSPIGSLFFNL